MLASSLPAQSGVFASGLSDISSVFAFGDSLVDSGNALAAARFIDSLPFQDLPDNAPTPEKGYFGGRFTDGYNFADLISNKLLGQPTQYTFPYGIEILGISFPFFPRPQGNSLNFAYGGAQIVRGGEVVPDLDGQTDAYLDGVSADPNALYIVSIGGNDIRDLVPDTGRPTKGPEARAALSAAAAELADEVGELVARGARHILVAGIPDVGLLPEYLGSRHEEERRSLATKFSERLDDMVDRALDRLTLPPDAQITHFDFLALSRSIIADPAAYALTNLTEARRDVQGSNLDPVGSGFLFFDRNHPSAQVHAIAAAEMLEMLQYVSPALTWGQPASQVALEIGPAVGGTISAVGEVDAFSLSLIAGQTYSFEARGIGSGSGSLADPVLRLLDGTGQELATDDDSGLALDALLQFVAPATASYSLQVTGFGALTGSYLVEAVTVATSVAEAFGADLKADLVAAGLEGAILDADLCALRPCDLMLL